MHGVVRQSAWDLAVECVEEALAGGAVPSLDRLGRLGQLGSLPSFIAALGEDEDRAALAADFTRERESLGFAPTEIAAELLTLGSLLERHGETDARVIVERCLLDAATRGRTVIFTGHDSERALRLAEHVLVLREGRIVLDGTAPALDQNAVAAAIGGAP